MLMILMYAIYSDLSLLSELRSTRRLRRSPMHHMNHHLTQLPTLTLDLTLSQDKTLRFLYEDSPACSPSNSKRQYIRG